MNRSSVSLVFLGLAGCAGGPDVTSQGALPLSRAVAICHVSGRGQPIEIAVDARVVGGHLRHGDAMGSCGGAGRGALQSARPKSCKQEGAPCAGPPGSASGICRNKVCVAGHAPGAATLERLRVLGMPPERMRVAFDEIARAAERKAVDYAAIDDAVQSIGDRALADKAARVLRRHAETQAFGAPGDEPRDPLPMGDGVLCDSCGVAAASLAPPGFACQLQVGATDTTCPSDFYGVDLTAGETYRFTLCNAGCSGATADYDTRLRIYDPSCALLQDNLDFCGAQSEITLTAATTGTYRVEVTGQTTSDVGNYTLGYHRLCPEPSGDCGSPISTLPEATTTCQTVTGSLSCGAGASYQITLTQGQNYTFSLCDDAACAGAGAAFDSTLELYQGGTLVASSTDACGANGKIVYQTDPLTGGGTYCVRIVRESGTGPYTLGWRVTCQAPSDVIAGPSSGASTNPECSLDQTFAVNTAGTGPFNYDWTVTPQGANTANPTTRTMTSGDSTDFFTTTLGGTGDYTVSVTVSNDCGTATETFTYTLGDAAGPNIECSAVEVPCTATSPGAATSAAASVSSRRGEIAGALLGSASTEEARRAIAAMLDVSPSNVAVSDSTTSSALLSQGLSCATPCTSGKLKAAHPFYDVYLGCGRGAFTARTGAAHSVTQVEGPQNVIYGGAAESPGTSDITLHVHNTNTNFLDPPGGQACVFDPPDTFAEPNNVGVEQEWSFNPMSGLNLTLREEIVAFGSTEPNSGVRLSLSVTNAPTSTVTANVGLRWQIDYQNAEDDGPGFAFVTCTPFSIGPERFTEHEFLPSEIRDFYRIQNNTGSPIFGNFTSTAPIIGFPGTAVPDRLVYGYWSDLDESPWNYVTTENNTAPDSDSATLVYYGYLPENGLMILPGQTVTRSVVIFTAGQSQSCGQFVPGTARDATVNTCSANCVLVGATATDNCGTPTVSLASASEGAPTCAGNPCTVQFPSTGTFTYTWQATDGAGNTSTCKSIVNVITDSAVDCSDGDLCNGIETCQNGTCLPGTPVDCDDQNPCTADSCDPQTGLCSHTPLADGTPCPDADLCNGTETCVAGQCTAVPVTCNDNNPCTTDACDPETGECTFTPLSNGAPCGDGNACNGVETCLDGACQPGTPVNCDDANACTQDSCDPQTGLCSHTPLANGISCSDGNACTSGDHCQDGACVGTPKVCTASDACHLAGTCNPSTGECPNLPAPDGTACSDGNPCTTGDACQGGVCVGVPKVCNTPTACKTADRVRCDMETGECVYRSLPNGASCADNDRCNGDETCQNGICAPGTPVVCDSPPACHTSAGATCNPATGTCTYPPAANGAPCSDGNACNGQETCQNGACAAGTPVVCSSPPPCHTATGATCDPATGACTYPPATNGTPCPDGDACNGEETCQGGACTAGTPPVDGTSCGQGLVCLGGACQPPPGTEQRQNLGVTGTGIRDCSAGGGAPPFLLGLLLLLGLRVRRRFTR
jgi:hypothetical protein